MFHKIAPYKLSPLVGAVEKVFYAPTVYGVLFQQSHPLVYTNQGNGKLCGAWKTGLFNENVSEISK